MKRNKNNLSFRKQKSYVLAAGLMVVAILGMTGVYLSEQSRQRKQEDLQVKLEELEQQTADSGKVAEDLTTPVDQIIKPETKKVKEENDEEETEESDNEIDTEEDTEVTNGEAEEETEEIEEDTEETLEQIQSDLHFEAATELSWPLQGSVLLDYSMDQTVYFATLEQYKYNPAMIIQGEVNEKVLSVAKGKIAHIETNEETGYTVTVDLGDGYSAVYGQLKEVPFHAGDYIEAGEVMGYINEPTKYYSVEGPNLYFQLLKDNESINPMEYLQ